MFTVQPASYIEKSYFPCHMVCMFICILRREGGREGGGEGGWGCTGIRGQGFHQDRVQVVQGLPGTCLNVLNAQLSCLYKIVKSWEYAEN